MSTRINRSTFLKGLVGCGAAALAGKFYLEWTHPNPQIPCRMLGPNRTAGHNLRDGHMPLAPSSAPEEIETIIIGGGIAGLSAAWWLDKQGKHDIALLELEDHVGGNASSGKNNVSAYPWGAHYVPLANAESQYVQELFQELGIITGFDPKGMALYNDLYLCHDPQERLFKDGTFQDGLVPKRGLNKAELAEIARFFRTVRDYRKLVGSDGKPAFAIPLDLSSQEADVLELDKISMAEWMQRNGFQSRPLHWYVNYCCRDDYGSTLQNVSAWAGIHYFAGRRGMAANAEMNSVVTWPEGNGFLVNKLREKLARYIRTQKVVTHVALDDDGEHVLVTYCDLAHNGACSQIRSKQVVFAAPRFLAKYLIPAPAGCQADAAPGEAEHGADSDPEYAPWMVANVTARFVPDAKGIPLSWDNVSYYSDSLGYVVATHQDITTREGPTVLTYYYPLSQQDPRAARQQLLASTAPQWSHIILADLEKMHPGISECITSIDLWPWGHGMVRPSVGFIWGATRRRMKDSRGGRIFFAHSDMSGISNFEEAQYHGVEAAKAILAKPGSA